MWQGNKTLSDPPWNAFVSVQLRIPGDSQHVGERNGNQVPKAAVVFDKWASVIKKKSKKKSVTSPDISKSLAFFKLLHCSR